MEVVGTESRFDLFHSLETEKKTRILNAALEEFAEKGFKRASTNSIVEKAGIGKGMLFYYFGSKEELYAFLCEYVIEFAKREYLGKLTDEKGDFLARYRQIAEIKGRALIQHPLLTDFAASMLMPENAPYAPSIMSDIDGIRQGFVSVLYEGLDYSLFREDIEPERVLTYIRWLTDSRDNDMARRIKTGELSIGDKQALEAEWKNFYEFLDDVRKILYKV